MAALTRKKSIESLTDLFSRYVIDEEREELDLPFIRDTLRFAARGVGKGTPCAISPCTPCLSRVPFGPGLRRTVCSVR